MSIIDKFISACRTGDLVGAQLILNNNPNLNFSDLNDAAFHDACRNGHLHVAQWLKSIQTVSANVCLAFQLACRHGHLQVAQWLHSTFNVSAVNEHFQVACTNGHLQVAQWLLQVNPDIDVSANNEYAFIWACRYNRFNVAQWLLQVKPDINISADNDLAFRNACRNHSLDLAKWLLQIKPDINISANDDISYNLYTYEWFHTLNPFRYILEDVKIDKNEPVLFLLYVFKTYDIECYFQHDINENNSLVLYATVCMNLTPNLLAYL